MEARPSRTSFTKFATLLRNELAVKFFWPCFMSFGERQSAVGKERLRRCCTSPWVSIIRFSREKARWMGVFAALWYNAESMTEKKRPIVNRQILRPDPAYPETAFWLAAGNFEEGFSPQKTTVEEFMKMLERHPHSTVAVVLKDFKNGDPYKEYSLHRAGDSLLVWAAKHERGGVDVNSIKVTESVWNFFRQLGQIGLGHEVSAVLFKML